MKHEFIWHEPDIMHRKFALALIGVSLWGVALWSILLFFLT